MTATTTSLRPSKPPRGPILWIVPVIFAVVAAVFVLNLAQSEPGRESVTVQNPTGTYVTLSAKGDTGGWLGIGTVDPRSRAKFDSIADQGRVWHFRLTVGPDRIGDIVRTKDQLDQAGWRISVPAHTTDKLDEQRRSQ